jgi:hypothetical protein
MSDNYTAERVTGGSVHRKPADASGPLGMLEYALQPIVAVEEYVVAQWFSGSDHSR